MLSFMITEGMDALEAEAKAYPTRTDKPNKVAIKDMQLMPSVFQPRQHVSDPQHVAELKRAIQAKPKDQPFLTPMTLWPCGRYFYVLDGHQRYRAYKEAGINRPVPVVYFTGNVVEAVRKALRDNSQDKLPLGKAEKLNGAWLLVRLNHYDVSKISTSEIMHDTGRSEGTVHNMKRALRELEEKLRSEGRTADQTRSDIMSLDWHQAKEALKGKRDFTEEDMDRIIAEWVQKLNKGLGMPFASQPHIAARALAEFAPSLPDRLVRVFFEEGIVDQDHYQYGEYEAGPTDYPLRPETDA